MQDEMKSFLRLLCTISATMASLCFVGVGVIITILYETKETTWRTVAYFGAMAVFSFAATSVLALMLLYPKLKMTKEGKKFMLLLVSSIFAIGWICFFILIAVLVTALSI